MSVTAGAYLLAVLLACGGLFSVSAGIAGWDWFFNSINVRMLTGRLRRQTARVVYVVVGLFIIGMSVYMFHAAKNPVL